MKISEYAHTPVLLDEVLQGLKLQTEGIYIDCTFGRGGHSQAILQHIGQAGQLFAIDKDPDAISSAHEGLCDDCRLTLVQGSYTMLDSLVREYGIQGRVNGILFDLGVSSPQFDNCSRGFSFQHDGPLDMRMNNLTGLTAAEWLASAGGDEIRKVLQEYGEERYARRIANAIVNERLNKPVESTHQLAEIITSAVPTRERDKHPATRTFQAIRIFINDELNELRNVLSQTIDILTCGGRLVVISFHSLEDRLVKRFMRRESHGDYFPHDVPVTQDALRPKLKIVGRVIHPTTQEMTSNPRSRSAVLRIAEKIVE